MSNPPADTPVTEPGTLFRKWHRITGFVAPFTPTGGDNDGIVRDAQGRAVADCFGHEACADTVAASLNMAFRPATPPVVSGDDLGEALDEYERCHAASILTGVYSASAARERIESLVAALRAENEKKHWRHIEDGNKIDTLRTELAALRLASLSEHEADTILAATDGMPEELNDKLIAIVERASALRLSQDSTQ